MTDKLSAVRARIDALDRKIAALLSRRFTLAASLCGLKKKVTDRAREKRVLANAGAAAGRAYAAPARAVFTEIMKQSRKVQGGK